MMQTSLGGLKDCRHWHNSEYDGLFWTGSGWKKIFWWSSQLNSKCMYVSQFQTWPVLDYLLDTTGESIGAPAELAPWCREGTKAVFSGASYKLHSTLMSLSVWLCDQAERDRGSPLGWLIGPQHASWVPPLSRRGHNYSNLWRDGMPTPTPCMCLGTLEGLNMALMGPKNEKIQFSCSESIIWAKSMGWHAHTRRHAFADR